MVDPIPQPGPTSNIPDLKSFDFKYTKYMTKDEVIKKYPVRLRLINEVMNDTLDTAQYYTYILDVLKAGITTNARANKVNEYANYLKKYPMSRLRLPPIVIVGDRFHDGTHRLSAIHLLENLLDQHNPVWSNFKLKVNFYK